MVRCNSVKLLLSMGKYETLKLWFTIFQSLAPSEKLFQQHGLGDCSRLYKLCGWSFCPADEFLQKELRSGVEVLALVTCLLSRGRGSILFKSFGHSLACILYKTVFLQFLALEAPNASLNVVWIWIFAKYRWNIQVIRAKPDIKSACLGTKVVIEQIIHPGKYKRKTKMMWILHDCFLKFEDIINWEPEGLFKGIV